MIKKDDSYPDQLRISRFQPGKQDQRAVVPNSVPAVSAAIVSIGGTYGDVIAMLRAAKDKGFLLDQLAIDPLPAPVRRYYRDRDGNDTGSSDEEAPKSREDESDEDEEASLG